MNRQSQLAILGVGVHLPDSVLIKELAKDDGGDIEAYEGWPATRIGGEDDHPGKMAAAALGRALDMAGIPGSKLQAVISTGMSREYLGSWSCAAEVIHLHNLPSTCMPLDTSCGCLATLWSLSLAQGWLAAQGGGYAAIVAGERLSGTVDRADNSAQHLWPYGDGASALVVGVNVPEPAIWRLESWGLASRGELANILRVEYGGTRHPLPPVGATNFRRFKPVPLSDVRAAYVGGYSDAFERAFSTTAVRPEWVVCNQMSPNFLPEIARFAGVDLDHVVVTGNDCGHIGSADIGIGLTRLVDQGLVDVPVGLGASTPFAFGAAVLAPGL